MFVNVGGSLTAHSGASFSESYDGSAGWTDYDNDGDVDLIITGSTGSGSPFTKIYRNNDNSNTFTYNTDPLPPSNLQTTVMDNIVEFTWDKGSDNETPEDGLSYNIRIGFSPDTEEIASAMSDGNGKRLIYEIGNVGQSTSWEFRHFGLGTYYFSVQTIDQCGCGSAFASSESFAILQTGIDVEKFSNNEIIILQNPVRDNLKFVYGKEYENISLSIISSSGKTFIQKNLKGGKHSINVESLSPGLYILQLGNSNRLTSVKFIVK